MKLCARPAGTTVAARLLMVTLTMAAAAGGAVAAESAVDVAADLPRLDPLDAAAARQSLRLAAGFRVELAAGEDLLASPVAIAWDEDGRLFVAEMRGYSEHREERLGRIRLLTDTDDDGIYDRAGVFAADLAWPTALCCSDGGLFVGDAPDIVYLKDTDGDGTADVRRTVFTGFGTRNVQGLLNSFTFAADNRIHGSASSTGGRVRQPGADAAVDLSRRDFSFDPRSLDLRAETGGAQHGLSFDDEGGKYVCHNSDQAIRCMIEDRLLSRNRFFPAPDAKASIAADGPQGEVFRMSPVEPWRVLRTQMRVAGLARGPIEVGGKATGYFTSATGITAVGGDAFGPELSGMLVIGDVGSNLVHRKRLVAAGCGVRAERIDAGCELVAAADNWFRPVQFANGPDGGLWIIDMQREVIEHPDAFPPEIKRHIDLDSGRDRGRLWRLVPDGYRRRPTPRLSQATTAELVDLLGHANVWHRDTAQRLLFERRDPAAVSLLDRLARDDTAAPRGRRRALWLLAGQGGLAAGHVLAGLDAEDRQVRIAAVRLSERVVGAGDDGRRVADRLVAMASAEPEAAVRMQVALAAGWLDGDRRRRVVDAVLRQDAADPWCRVAAFTSLEDGAGDLLVSWLADATLVTRDGVADVLTGLAAQVARRGDAGELDAVVGAAAALASHADGRESGWAAATAVLVGLRGSGESTSRSVAALLDTADRRRDLEQLVRWNRQRVLDAQSPVSARLAGIRGLAIAPLADVADSFAALLAAGQPEAVVRAALTTLDGLRDPAVANVLIAAWGGLTTDGRTQAAAALARDPQRIGVLLDAVAAGMVPEADLPRTLVDNLRGFPLESVRNRARDVFGELPAVSRTDLLEAYRPSLARGDAASGGRLFARHCAGCHRVDGVGREIGPNLVAMQARGAEAILLGVLDPNREVQPQYVAHTVVTADGRVVTGLVVAESEASVTIRSADGGEQTIARDDIEEFLSTKKSLMPEGFERELDLRAMGDLLAWLMAAK
jgi:putative membrane-bound dehydrogenase-like protein